MDGPLLSGSSNGHPFWHIDAVGGAVHTISLGGDYEDPHGTHLLGAGTYVLALAEFDTLESDTGGVSGGYTFEYEVSVVPLPPSAILFGTALLGLAGLKRAKRKA